jgi:Fic family protein
VAHVQFETIHPFLDGNGRIGRLLIALLLEHWGLLASPMLYLSVALKRRQQEYYTHLTAVRVGGEWEAWTAFYLQCVREAAEDGVRVAERMFALLGSDRTKLLARGDATVAAVRLLDLLPANPVVTLPRVVELLGTSKPTAGKAIGVLQGAGILQETSGRRRDRIYGYQAYLDVLTGG